MDGKKFEALLDDIKHQLEKIKMYVDIGNDGYDHELEDDLLYFVLRTIREKNMTMEQAKLLINEAFQVRDIEFSHWYE